MKGEFTVKDFDINRIIQGKAPLDTTSRTCRTQVRKLCSRYLNVKHLHSVRHSKAAKLYFVKRQDIQTHAVLRGVEEVKAPTFPDSVSSGDVKLIKKEGDAVAMDEVVLEIETDKTALPVMSPGHGTIAKMLVKEGQSVKSQQPLFTVNVTGVAPAATSPAPAAATAPPAAAAPAPAPATARAPVAAPAPTTAAAGKKQAAPTVVKKAAAPAGPTLAAKIIGDPTKTISGTRTEHPVEMNRMRKRIAERLKEAQNTTAMLTTFNECDMSKLMAFRKANLETFTKKYGVKLSFMSPFLKASANALMDQPVINGVIMGDNIVYRDYVDISVAVATPRGLVTPVVRNVESMDFPRIELAIAALAEKARNGRLTPGDMQGGTFTISNGGVFGSLLSMPIINMPQSAILGMHAIVQRPVALAGKVEIRPMMYLALSYDHRLIDGREAVMFLRKVKSGVEDPTSILAGI
ncbi:dihydrolipoyllysine-residue succinyltransferase component of 2-oxoglutarate dehydrogenase complex, mitochondrial-like [Pararge aegeria]|uniref:dihydrolipoyllysine-residue succinyltransferase component of 2-oxoglutarate dehydrogenase complex, mitochondrial-like n=1 Tax=Pararge aegeria TaxID=116150 RepID=UPI0019D199F5|nr:dihydrolipoyllysine-residue succinyltransferase component of 2-oxoglutarate dehydrogenase complex, mitochondrial-like [Pararge aegeria]